MMAKYDVTYSCGHTGTVELYGKHTDREHKLEWMHDVAVCPECYAKKQQEALSIKRADALVAIAQREEALVLPALTGTEKQVAWARALRDTLVQRVREQLKSWRMSFNRRMLITRCIFEEHEGTIYPLSVKACAIYKLPLLYDVNACNTQWFSDMIAHVRTITDAKWYIDNRNVPDIPEDCAFNALLDSYIASNPISVRIPGEHPLNGDTNVAGGVKRAEQIRSKAMDCMQMYIKEYKNIDSEVGRTYLSVVAATKAPEKMSYTEFYDTMVQDIAYALCAIKSSAWYLAYDRAQLGNSPDPDTQAIFYGMLKLAMEAKNKSI